MLNTFRSTRNISKRYKNNNLSYNVIYAMRNKKMAEYNNEMAVSSSARMLSQMSKFLTKSYYHNLKH